MATKIKTKSGKIIPVELLFNNIVLLNIRTIQIVIRDITTFSKKEREYSNWVTTTRNILEEIDRKMYRYFDVKTPNNERYCIFSDIYLSIAGLKIYIDLQTKTKIKSKEQNVRSVINAFIEEGKRVFKSIEFQLEEDLGISKEIEKYHIMVDAGFNFLLISLIKTVFSIKKPNEIIKIAYKLYDEDEIALIFSDNIDDNALNRVILLKKTLVSVKESLQDFESFIIQTLLERYKIRVNFEKKEAINYITLVLPIIKKDR